MQSTFTCPVPHRGWSCTGLKSFGGNIAHVQGGGWGKAVNLPGVCFHSCCLCPADLLLPTAPSSSSGCCHQLGCEGSRHTQRCFREQGTQSWVTVNLLSYFSFSQPLLAGKNSSRSWQLQEVRQKLWAEPSMGRSLSPKTALKLCSSPNRM